MDTPAPQSAGDGGPRRSVLRWLIPALISTGLAVSLLLVLVPREQRRLYREGIEEHRRQIDQFMRFSPESPLLESDKRVFTGLRYFPVDEAYRVEAKLERIEDTPVFGVPTTGGSDDLYERFAWAEFELEGATYRTLVLRGIDISPSNRLFLAFTDETNGEDTYAGGRYVDLYFSDPTSVTIDFNRAYNPYCVYDPSYVCPLPPSENNLPVRIEAGELAFKRSSGS